MPALLRHHLVLQVDPRDAGLLVVPHRAHDVDRVAVAGVGVGDRRHVDGRDDPPGVVDHLRAGQQPDVRAPDQRGRGPKPGHVDDVEPGLLHEPRGEGVVRPGGDDRARAGQQLAQPGPRCCQAVQEVCHADVLSSTVGRVTVLPRERCRRRRASSRTTCRADAVLLSGPAGGVTVRCGSAGQTGYSGPVHVRHGRHITDVALVQGLKPRIGRETKIGDLTVRARRGRADGRCGRRIDRARPELTKALRVGPQSAGAGPGRAGYGRGGSANRHRRERRARISPGVAGRWRDHPGRRSRAGGRGRGRRGDGPPVAGGGRRRGSSTSSTRTCSAACGRRDDVGAQRGGPDRAAPLRKESRRRPDRQRPARHPRRAGRRGLFSFLLTVDHELVSARATVIGPRPSVAPVTLRETDGPPEPVDTHPIHLSGATVTPGSTTAPRCGPGDVITGPAIVTEMDSTLVPPGHAATVHASGSLLIRPED